MSIWPDPEVLAPESRAAIDALSEFPMPGAVSVAALRESLERLIPVVALPGPALLRIWDRTVIDEDRCVPVRVYVPGSDAGDVFVYIHGGGWVSGTLDTHDALARRLAQALAATVISVDYRLAPEAPFPASLDDVLSVLRSARALVGAAGTGADGLLGVVGDSAGGTLAASAAIVAAREGPALDVQVLINPVLEDHRTAAASLLAPMPVVYVRLLEWEWDQYLPRPGDVAANAAVPLRHGDLQGVAPAVIHAAEFDALAGEGRRYGERLGQAGVRVVHREVPGAIHGFIEHTRMGSLADREMDALAGMVRAVLRK